MKFVIGSSPGNGEPTQLSRTLQKNCGLDRRVVDLVTGVRAAAAGEGVVEPKPVTHFVRAGVALVVGQHAVGLLVARTCEPRSGQRRPPQDHAVVAREELVERTGRWPIRDRRRRRSCRYSSSPGHLGEARPSWRSRPPTQRPRNTRLRWRRLRGSRVGTRTWRPQRRR